MLKVAIVSSPEDFDQALKIRRTVFIDEQGVAEAEELDGRDGQGAVHILAQTLGGVPVGTSRILLPESDGDAAHIGRVAVVKEFRGQGIGKKIMLTAHKHLQSLLAPTQTMRVELSAQEHALDFYTHLGYEVYGNAYLDAGIRHRDAYIVLAANPQN